MLSPCFFGCQGQQINLEIRTKTRGNSRLLFWWSNYMYRIQPFERLSYLIMHSPSRFHLNEPQLLISPCHSMDFLKTSSFFCQKNRHKSPNFNFHTSHLWLDKCGPEGIYGAPSPRRICPEKVDLWELLGQKSPFFFGKAATWYLFTCLSPKQLQR